MTVIGFNRDYPWLTFTVEESNAVDICAHCGGITIISIDKAMNDPDGLLVTGFSAKHKDCKPSVKPDLN